MNREELIKKCFAIASWATRRGKANLRGDDKDFDRCDRIIGVLLIDLIRYIDREGKTSNAG